MVYVSACGLTVRACVLTEWAENKLTFSLISKMGQGFQFQCRFMQYRRMCVSLCVSERGREREGQRHDSLDVSVRDRENVFGFNHQQCPKGALLERVSVCCSPLAAI